MCKKSIFTVLVILILPLVAFWALTFNKTEATIAEASGQPQVFKFSSLTAKRVSDGYHPIPRVSSPLSPCGKEPPLWQP